MKVCISGSISIRVLPASAVARLEQFLALGAEVLIGDAPGAEAESGLAVWDGRSPGTARNIRQLGGRMEVVRA